MFKRIYCCDFFFYHTRAYLSVYFVTLLLSICTLLQIVLSSSECFTSATLPGAGLLFFLHVYRIYVFFSTRILYICYFFLHVYRIYVIFLRVYFFYVYIIYNLFFSLAATPSTVVFM